MIEKCTVLFDSLRSGGLHVEKSTSFRCRGMNLRFPRSIVDLGRLYMTVQLPTVQKWWYKRCATELLKIKGEMNIIVESCPVESGRVHCLLFLKKLYSYRTAHSIFLYMFEIVRVFYMNSPALYFFKSMLH